MSEEFLSFNSEPFKITHKREYLIKRYTDHLEEMRKIGEKILNYYGLDPYKEIFNELVTYHDSGKLLNIWNLESSKNISHSFFSSLYYYRFVESTGNVKPENFFLIFFIYRHHSPLYFPDLPSSKEGIEEFIRKIKVPKFKSIKVLDESFNYHDIKEGFLRFLITTTQKEINKYLEGVNSNHEKFKKIINLVDVFGIFKLSDNISASFKHICLEKTFSKIRMKTSRLTNLYFIAKRKRKNKEKLKEQIEIVRNSDNPSIIILPTGYGKTLIHLLFISKWKPTRVFYILPTITAIKKFYEEIKEIFKDVGRKYYFVDVEDEYDDIVDGNFLRKINIITIDQFLRTFLQLGKYYARRFLFRDSLIIIDEFHLLNENMLVLTLHFLKKYFEIYKLKIVFSSATLNKQYLSEILNYFDRIWINGNLIENKGFNEIKTKILEKYPNKQRFKLEIIEGKDLLEDLERIIEFSKYKKILVITNVVNKAISIYKKLEELKIKNKILLHGRFSYVDRDFKERKLYELLSKDKTFIFVSTQVSEVSLDVDFDILFTEASSIPSLIQRFGRVNRNGEKEGCFVFLYKPKDIEVQKLVYKNIEQTFNFFKKHKDLPEREWIGYYFDMQELELEKIKEMKRLINIFETSTGYFYSFSKKDNENDFWKLVNFRESYSISVLLDPEIIDNQTLKFWKILTGIDYKKSYEKYYKENGEDKKELSKKLKRFLVPINIRDEKVINEMLEEEKLRGYPTLSKKVAEKFGIRYSHKFGLYIEKEEKIL